MEVLLVSASATLLLAALRAGQPTVAEVRQIFDKAAAIEADKAGSSVVILEKAPFLITAALLASFNASPGQVLFPREPSG